ncbi:SHOCT domain-containing protein [Chryseobacterium sp. MMS23-Vi53]|uniref:SHOCT domain-containing protein n=1 Tax=Chryseobacterium sp. MMS23-Vi53 TaxID=3386644 RepID=UPI0039E7D77F
MEYFPQKYNPELRFVINGKNVDFQSSNGANFYNKMKDFYNTTKPESKQEIPIEKESPDKVFDQLEKLGNLHENGILTNEEFTEQKKKLLEKL